MLSFAERSRGDHEASATHAEAAAEQVHALDEDDLPSYLVAFVLNRVGHEAYELGDWSRAEAVLEEALDRWRHLGNPWGTGIVLVKLGDIAQARGEEARAAEFYVESLDLWWGQDNPLGTVEILTGLARLAVRKQPELAARLFGAVAALQGRIGLAPAPVLRARNDRALAVARVALGEKIFEAAWLAGSDLPMGRAIAEAKTVSLEASRTVRPDPGSSAVPGSLSSRELEVLKLVATGLSNAQVAQELFLSSRTVNTHLTSIYRKLEVPSRSAATRFAVEQGLV
jgi:ATP/maltotriose-dependent transcriptional regulator MalT